MRHGPTEAEDSPGVTDQIIKAIDSVSEHIGNHCTWAIDRQGNNNALIEKFIDNKKQPDFQLSFPFD